MRAVGVVTWGDMCVAEAGLGAGVVSVPVAVVPTAMPMPESSRVSVAHRSLSADPTDVGLPSQVRGESLRLACDSGGDASAAWRGRVSLRRMPASGARRSTPSRSRAAPRQPPPPSTAGRRERAGIRSSAARGWRDEHDGAAHGTCGVSGATAAARGPPSGDHSPGGATFGLHEPGEHHVPGRMWPAGGSRSGSQWGRSS